MKKIFTFAALFAATLSAQAASDFTGLVGPSQTFNQYGGNFKDMEGQDFDATAYDYVWIKWSGLTGQCNFIITYNDWKSTESWGETFKDEAVTLASESGVACIKLNKSSKIVNGNAKENGQFKGDIYAKHVRQLAVQATSSDGATITVEEVKFGTADEYKTAAGISEKNHVVKLTADTKAKNHWDYQFGKNVDLPFGGTYHLVGKTKTTVDDAILDVWTDNGVSYPNTKTVYGNPQIKPTKEWSDFDITLAPGKVEDNEFDIKHISIITDIVGDVFFDDLKIVDDKGNELTKEGFEIDYGGWTANGVKSSLVEEVSDVVSAINAPVKAKLNNGQAYNLMGQKVGKNAKGIFIINGKKVIR